MKIPPETQTGQVFRLRGKGIKGVRASYPGDLLCEIVVETPVQPHRAPEGTPARAGGDQPPRRRPPQSARQVASWTRCGSSSPAEAPLLRRVSGIRVIMAAGHKFISPREKSHDYAHSHRFSPSPSRRAAASRRASPIRRSSSASPSRSRGPAQELGKDMQLGASLYFNHVNAQGRRERPAIVLKTLDDGYEPARAAENTKKLINDERCSRSSATWARPRAPRRCPSSPRRRCPFVGAFTGAELLRNPVQPLHLQRPGELLRRDGSDRPAPHRDEHRQDRHVLPERRVRPGRARRRRARAQEAQARAGGQGHGRAQHRRRRQGGGGDAQGGPAGGDHDQRLQVAAPRSSRR